VEGKIDGVNRAIMAHVQSTAPKILPPPNLKHYIFRNFWSRRK